MNARSLMQFQIGTGTTVACKQNSPLVEARVGLYPLIYLVRRPLLPWCNLRVRLNEHSGAFAETLYL